MSELSVSQPLCALCSQSTTVSMARLRGYREDCEFAVHECAECRTKHVQPLQSDAGIYGAIYAQPERIPGYARYTRYAEAVLRHAEPLQYLSAQEECYWAIAESLRRNFTSRDIGILEVGCGLGYLTYALSRDGYRKILGIDWSEPAVAAARARYGMPENYEVGDIETLAVRRAERFDAIVLSEVIEHVENPVALLKMAGRLLKPGGIVICTTPNRDFGDLERQCWATELPPVHLWWFGEKSMFALADSADMNVELVDFSRWNRRHFRRYCKALRRSRRVAAATPVFDANLKPIRTSSQKSRSDGALRRILDGWRDVTYRLRYARHWLNPAIHRATCIGAVFRRAHEVAP